MISHSLLASNTVSVGWLQAGLSSPYVSPEFQNQICNCLFDNPPWTSKALPRSLCGQWPRSSATLHLASPAVTGADLCWCPCSAQGGGRGRGRRRRRSPPSSAVQVAKLLIDCSYFCSLFLWPWAWSSARSSPCQQSYLLLHVFWIRISSINRIPSAFYHLWIFSKLEAFWLCFSFF